MSRWDSHGALWQEQEREKKQGGGMISSVRPVTPNTGWVKPRISEINLKAADIIGLDLETRDPNLRDKGPGPRRRDDEGGFIAGIAVSVGPRDGEQWYIPMRHENDDRNNLDPEMAKAWARDNLCNPNQPKIGANLMYDFDWLLEEGVPVCGDMIDVQNAEPLIDENAFTYSLDRLANDYLDDGKEDEVMYQWLGAVFGGEPNRKDQAKNIWRAPAELAGPYAESDVRLPFQIWEKQKAILTSENLWDVYNIEQRITPLLLAMRRRGVQVDLERAKETDTKLVERAAEFRKGLEEQRIDPWSGDTLAAYCDRKGIKYGLTPAKNPSFPGAWLEKQNDEVLQMVYEVRRLEKHAGTFIEGTILSNQINGRIHCQFNQLRNDDFGAVSGRFSSSNPNLQNIPARDEELGPLIRSLFIADQGQAWYSDDWSQIEFRLLVHFAAALADSREVYMSALARQIAHRTAQRYHQDPSTDFHTYVADISGIDRKPAKNINFGLVYGMGQATLASNLGRSLEEVIPIFDKYHEALPFIREIYQIATRRAEATGYIRTILGRRRRFNLWTSKVWKESKSSKARPKEAAIEEWGKNRIRRAGGHKALNALLQGSAADIMKLAMADIWDAGLCDVLGIPLLTVHDELNWSFEENQRTKEAHREALNIMESCVKLKLPLMVDSGTGANWGIAK